MNFAEPAIKLALEIIWYYEPVHAIKLAQAYDACPRHTSFGVKVHPAEILANSSVCSLVKSVML